MVSRKLFLLISLSVVLCLVQSFFTCKINKLSSRNRIQVIKSHSHPQKRGGLSLSLDMLSTNQKLSLPFALAASVLLPFFVMPSYALNQQYKLPPIDRRDPNRCTLVSSSMGQANAARDKLYDLRECNLQGQSGAGKDISGFIGSEADFSGVDFKEAQLSKGFARYSKFVGTDFTNGIIDRVSFDGSDLRNSIFKNAVLSGTTFAEANVENADFSDAYLGPFDLKNLCLNPTLKGVNPVTKVDTRTSAGCLD